MHTLHASLIPSPSRRHPPSKESIKKKRKSAGQETKHACAPQISALSPAAPQFSNTRPLAQFKKRRERNSHHERGGLGRGEEDRKLPPEIPTPLPRSTTSSTSRAPTLKNQGKRTGSRCWGEGSHYLHGRHLAKLPRAPSKTPAIQGEDEGNGPKRKRASETTVLEKKNDTRHRRVFPVHSLVTAAAAFQGREKGRETETGGRRNKHHGGRTQAALVGHVGVWSGSACPLPFSVCVQLSGTAVLSPSSPYPPLFC